MSAIINNYRQLDVAFLLLNDLTTKLRTAGARISVRKVGNFHRITVLKEPTVASIEQILSDNGEKTETRNLSSSNEITSPTKNTSLPDDAVNVANTVPTVNEEIEDNSVVEAILPESSKSPSLSDETLSEVNGNTVTVVNEDIEDNSVVEAIVQNTLPKTITLPISPEFTSQLDDSPSSDSKDIIPCDTAELITDSSDSPTPDHSSSEITNIPTSPELASLEDLQTLTLKRLKELAKFYKIPGFSRMKEEKLATKLHGIATKEQIL